MPKSPCAHCSQMIEYPESMEGEPAECPSCGKPTTLTQSVPLIRIPKRKETAPSASAQSPTARVASQLIASIEQAVIGKRAQIEVLLVACFSEGHVLIEDVPGVAKTILARALAQSLGASFKRIQCTPDLLPNDITGSSVFNPKTSEFVFRPGPVFCNILLADEINRATPRTQSALLEAMAERQVTVDGQDYPLEPPFLLLATQNPVEHEGTFPLPEAQLDRFFVRLSLGYPGAEGELEMLARFQEQNPLAQLEPVSTKNDLLECQAAARRIFVHPSIREYLLQIVHGTRIHEAVRLGASPRGSLALLRASQSLAALQGYDFVLPDHVKEMAPHVLSHRLLLRPETKLRKTSAEKIVRTILDQTDLPSGDWSKP